MTAEPKALVYRLRRLPGHFDRLRAVNILSRALGDVGPEDIKISSLALTADPWERPPTRIATLTFSKTTALVQNASDKTEWQIPVLGLDSPLILDSHFFGITPLNDVLESKHSHDCIAISGLASHPFGSWQPHGGDKAFMWIRDTMPLCRPCTRFVIYGYDTKLVGSHSFQTIKDLAGTLVSSLKANGWASPMTKPIIFLAHSLGGVILKQAIVMMAGAGELEKHTLSMVKGAMFFGVPSKGMVTSHLLTMVSGQPNQVLVKDLSEQSEYLRQLEKQFRGISLVRKLKLIWAFETKESRTVVELPNGSFSRSGSHLVLVTKESAINNTAASESESESESTLQIDEDHSGMVKFCEGDHRLTIIASKICDIEKEGWQDRKRPTEQVDPVEAPPQSKFSLVEDDDILWDSTTETLKDLSISNPTSNFRSVLWDLEKAMKSLRPPNQDRRIDQIDDAKDYTFEWVFEDESLGFSSWLRDGTDGIFWISGKPGSGKSTLMKFIYNDTRTQQLLHRFGSKKQHLTPAFFFHYRGDALQKSFEGLLRGILSQILHQMPQLRDILRSIFEKMYDELVDAEKLGDLSSDLVVFFKRLDQNIDSDLVNALNSLVSLVLSCQDVFAEINRVFGSFMDTPVNKAKVGEIQIELLECQQTLFALEGRDLDKEVRRTCGLLGFGPESGFPNLLHKWRNRADLKKQVRQLLSWRGIAISDQTERYIQLIDQRQRRREELRTQVQTEGWTKNFLERVLLDVLNQRTTRMDITIFLDAVDEYDGRPEFISTFLKDLVQHEFPMTRIRICCSSRPWKGFTDKFGSSPGFRIHDYTEGDIRQYSYATINYSLPSSGLLFDMVPNIVQKANGVFLWVRLVIEHLTKVALNETDDLKQLGFKLKEILDSLPDQLDEFYQTIINRIPESLRWDTYVILEVLSRSERVLSPVRMLQILGCSTVRSLTAAKEIVQQVEMLSKTEVFTRLKVRTGGLVEVFRDEVVQVMHQTVKEFVESREFKYQVLGDRGKVTWENGHSFLAWYYASDTTGSISTYDPHLPSTSDLPVPGTYHLPSIDDFYLHARKSEHTTGRSQFDRLSEASREPWYKIPTPAEKVDIKLDPLSVGIYIGLRLLIKDVVSADRNAFVSVQPHKLLVSALGGKVQEADEAVGMAKFIKSLGFCATGAEVGNLGLTMIAKNRSQTTFRQAVFEIITTAIADWDTMDEVMVWQDNNTGTAGSGTLLHLSTPQLAEYLITRGANPNTPSYDGLSPLDCVVRNDAGYYDLEEICSIMSLLVRAGGKFSKTTKKKVRGMVQQMEKAGLKTDFVGTRSGIKFPDWIDETPVEVTEPGPRVRGILAKLGTFKDRK